MGIGVEMIRSKLASNYCNPVYITCKICSWFKYYIILIIIVNGRQFVGTVIIYTYVHVFEFMIMFGLFVQYPKSDFFVLSVWKCYVIIFDCFVWSQF